MLDWFDHDEWRDVRRQLQTLIQQGEKIMAELDDLKTILTDVLAKSTTVSTEVADLIARLSSTTPPSLAEVLGIARNIQATLSSIPPEPPPAA